MADTETTSPAVELREVAQLMRERTAGVPQNWHLTGSQIVAAGTDALAGTDVIASCMVPARAAYVASMHPGWTLAVAGWLADRSAHAEKYLRFEVPECTHEDGRCGCDRTPGWSCEFCFGWLGDRDGCDCYTAALKVARAYLGISQGTEPRGCGGEGCPADCPGALRGCDYHHEGEQ